MIRAEELKKNYGSFAALRSLSCHIPAGRFVAIMGDSGSGKTTFLNLLAGIDRADAGSLTVGSTRLHELDAAGFARYRRETVGLVFQDFNLLPTLSILDNVLIPALLKGGESDLPAAHALLDRMGIADQAGKYPRELSGGQQQRAGIARALLGRPPLLLADEPTGALDRRAKKEVLDLLREMNQEFGVTIVMATHSDFAAARADDVFHMEDGAFLAGPSGS